MANQGNTDSFKHIMKKIFDGTSWYLILIGSIVAWVFSCSQTVADVMATQKTNIAVFGIIAYVAVFAVAIYRKKDARTIIGLILIGSFLIRAYYMLAASYDVTKHDFGSFMGLNTTEVGSGHAGYIDYLYKNGHLFDFDPRTKWSFYQPPLFYIAAAFLLRITTLFGVAEPLCYESMQFVTLLFSSLTVWTGYRIIREFNLSDKLVVLLTAFLSFHPFFSVMSVTLTNDCMAMYFMLLAVWFTIRWQKAPGMRQILAVALGVGLSMACKLNAAIISFGIGTVFIYVFWNHRSEWKKYAVQFAVFLLICAPLGLFNPVRNQVKFDMPASFIQELGNDNPQLIKNSTAVSRLGIPSVEQISYAFPTFDTKVERNVWIQALRTSLFDELMPDVGSSLFGANALALLWVSVVLAVFMNIAFLWTIIRSSSIQLGMRLFLVVEYVAMLFSYASFCMSQPFICTMNYRYIPISMFFPLLGTAIWLQGSLEKDLGRYGRIMKNVLVGGMLCFCGLAVIIDLNLIAWSGTLL